MTEASSRRPPQFVRQLAERDRGKGAHRWGPAGEDFDHCRRVGYGIQKIAGRGECFGRGFDAADGIGEIEAGERNATADIAATVVVLMIG
jgi:hypothetical protein